MNTPDAARTPAPEKPQENNPFHPNLEQQKKRAKELSRAFRAGEADAVARFIRHHPKYNAESEHSGIPRGGLSEAQFVIARELGLPSWPKLKAHIDALDNAQNAIGSGTAAGDDASTLHIRCGSDLEGALQAAGFEGAFLEFSDPFCQGPVTNRPDWLSARIEFIIRAYGPEKARFCGEADIQTEAEIRRNLHAAETKLSDCAGMFDRVVLWFEHDTYDLLILMRLLARFHEFGRPDKLELVQLNSFPGSGRFIGLGQLPPAALRHIWSNRRPVTDDQLALGSSAWQALRRSDPGALHRLAGTATPALPDLAAALMRHLAELPDRRTGLSLTEKLTLQILADGARTAGRTFTALMETYEPLPFLGDLMFLDILLNMRKIDRPVFDLDTGPDPDHWPRWHLSITDLGRAVLEGQEDYITLDPPIRWVGGIEIEPGKPNWRWDAQEALPVKL